MKTEQWLALSKDELDIVLAEVLIKNPQHALVPCDKPKIKNVDNYTIKSHSNGKYVWCHQCRGYWLRGKEKYGDCPVPDPIDSSDWNVAKRLQKTIPYQVRNIKKWEKAMNDIWHCEEEPYYTLIHWLDWSAEPRHYLIAAAMAKDAE